MDMTRGQKQKEAGLSFPCNGHQPTCRSDIESAVLQGLVITLSTTNLRMTHVFAPSDQQYAAPNVCSMWLVQGTQGTSSDKVVESKQGLLTLGDKASEWYSYELWVSALNLARLMDRRCRVAAGDSLGLVHARSTVSLA